MRYSLKDLFLAMTLIAIGIAAWQHAENLTNPYEYPPLTLTFLFGPPILIGVGIGLPFRKKKFGAIAGFIVMLLFVCLAG